MLHRVIYRKVNKTQPWLETGQLVGRKSVAHTRNFPKGRHVKCQVNGRDHNTVESRWKDAWDGQRGLLFGSTLVPSTGRIA